MKKRLVLFAASLIALSASAQVTIGVMPSNLNTADVNFPTPQTDVSLENPATGPGLVTTVNFAWNGFCFGVVKIKFFRRSGNTLTMFAERGPFDANQGRPIQSVILSPGVEIQAGDLIGITRVAACGNALAEAGTGTQGYIVLQGDATSGTISAGNTFHDKLGLLGIASSPADAGTGYFAVVGSTAGSLGSNFKTSLQLYNPTGNTLSGRLIFHRSGTQGSNGDPSLAFSLNPGTIVSYPDVIAAMGQTGLGSLDLLMPPGSQLPVMAMRIYNDAGSGGTAGFFEELIGTSSGIGTHILTNGTQGFLLTPVEPARTRMNFGVRTLSSAVTMTVRLENAAGQVITTAPKSYPPNFFEQVDSGTFLNGAVLQPDQKVRIIVTGGLAIVYGSVTDNVTNDPSVQFATAMSQ